MNYLEPECNLFTISRILRLLHFTLRLVIFGTGISGISTLTVLLKSSFTLSNFSIKSLLFIADTFLRYLNVLFKLLTLDAGSKDNPQLEVFRRGVDFIFRLESGIGI